MQIVQSWADECGISPVAVAVFEEELDSVTAIKLDSKSFKLSYQQVSHTRHLLHRWLFVTASAKVLNKPFLALLIFSQRLACVRVVKHKRIGIFEVRLVCEAHGSQCRAAMQSCRTAALHCTHLADLHVHLQAPGQGKTAAAVLAYKHLRSSPGFKEAPPGFALVIAPKSTLEGPDSWCSTIRMLDPKAKCV